MEDITEIEQNEITSALQKDTAPGILSIGYKLIKNVNSKSRNHMINFANRVITKEEFPKKQELGQIYLISKNINQEYNLILIQLIILLKTFRKLVIRIVQKRLYKIISQKNILKDANFIRLPEKSIMALIYILNNIIEDAKQRNYNLQIAF